MLRKLGVVIGGTLFDILVNANFMIALADVFGKPVFVLINGVQYKKAFPAFVVLSIGIWLSILFSPLINIHIANRRFKFLVTLALSGFAISFAGNYVLVPWAGAIGADIVHVISYAFINVASAVKVFRGGRGHPAEHLSSFRT